MAAGLQALAPARSGPSRAHDIVTICPSQRNTMPPFAGIQEYHSRKQLKRQRRANRPRRPPRTRITPAAPSTKAELRHQEITLKMIANTATCANIEICSRMGAVLANADPHTKSMMAQHLGLARFSQIEDADREAWALQEVQLASDSADLLHEQLEIEVSLKIFPINPVDPQGKDRKRAIKRLKRVRASLRNAKNGVVAMKPNNQAKERTAILAELNTRDAMKAFLYQVEHDLTNQALSINYLEVRDTYIHVYAQFMREVEGVSPFRIELIIYAHRADMMWIEEDHWIAFFTFMRFKHANHCAIQAITHVKQFHVQQLKIAPIPPFQRLANNMRLFAHMLGKSTTPTRRRLYIKTETVLAIAHCCNCITTDTAVPFNVRRDAATLKCILLLAFRCAMRIVEATRGAAFNSKVHWSHKWLCQANIMTLKTGDKLTVQQPQRKCSNDKSRLPMLIDVDALDPLCFVTAYQQLRKLDPIPANSRQPAFRVSNEGDAACPSWVCRQLSRLAKASGTAQADLGEVSNHTLRRGAIAAWTAAGISPIVIEIMACIASHGTLAIYTPAIAASVLAAQRTMLSVTYENMEEDFPDISYDDAAEDYGPDDPDFLIAEIDDERARPNIAAAEHGKQGSLLAFFARKTCKL